MLASEAMHSGIRTLSPFLRRSETTAEGEAVVLGVVEGDVHEIGKNLVAVMLEAEGYRVINLGFDVSPSTFTEALERSGGADPGPFHHDDHHPSRHAPDG